MPQVSPCVFSSKLTKVYHKVMLIASTNLFFFASYNLFYIFLVLVGELRYLCGCKTVIVHIYNKLCLTFGNALFNTFSMPFAIPFSSIPSLRLHMIFTSLLNFSSTEISYSCSIILCFHIRRSYRIAKICVQNCLLFVKTFYHHKRYPPDLYYHI